MSGINLREPKPSIKRKQLEKRAIAIVNHMPQTQGQGLKSLSALLIPPLAAGYDVLPSLKAAGYDAAAFRAAGCDCTIVITAGFSAVEAKAAGYDAAAFRAAGCNLKTFTTAGFSLEEAKSAGYDAAAFRAAGCDWATVIRVGFTAVEAKAAGYDAAAVAPPPKVTQPPPPPLSSSSSHFSRPGPRHRPCVSV